MRKERIAGSRPARVRLSQPEPVTLAFGSKRLRAGLTTVSVTGGVLYMRNTVIQEDFADITIATAFGLVRSPIEFLRTTIPGQHHAAAFRFFNMDGEDCRRLERAIGKMLLQGLGERRPAWFQTLVRRLRKLA